MGGMSVHAARWGGKNLSRYSVVDVGSNTIHLLVGEVEGGEVLPVTGEKFSARLGGGVEGRGRRGGGGGSCAWPGRSSRPGAGRAGRGRDASKGRGSSSRPRP